MPFPEKALDATFLANKSYTCSYTPQYPAVLAPTHQLALENLPEIIIVEMPKPGMPQVSDGRSWEGNELELENPSLTNCFEVLFRIHV